MEEEEEGVAVLAGEGVEGAGEVEVEAGVGGKRRRKR